MNKFLVWAAAILGGLGVGMVVTIALINRFGTFCPVCGGLLGTEDETLVCKSCGARLHAQLPSA